MWRLGAALAVSALLALAACGGPSEADIQATVQVALQTSPVIVTQVVTQVVTQIVTVTPRPATATPIATPTPEQVQVAVATDTTIYGLPDETYREVLALTVGQQVTLDFQAEDWVAVQADGETGWVRRSALDVSDEQLAQVPAFPGPFVVVVGDVVQEELAGSIVFRGTIRNFGDEQADGVRAEIETFDESDGRVDLIQGYITDLNLSPGETGQFQAITQYDYATFTVRANCNGC